MCNFCSKQKSKNDDFFVNKKDLKNDSLANNFDAIIEGKKIIFSYDAYSCDSSFYEEVDITFCPICGKLL